ncbi:MAG: methanol--corrinoid methyltransferase [Bacteroidetes bacterium]|nr:methanol--corrinoid methyltransferase [Bacteroidota bacterium]
MKYKDLVIKNPEDLVFGRAPFPVTTPRGLVIGGGQVYPELNFTLPPMSINKETYSQVKNHYREIVSGALERVRDLHQDGVVFEFETLLEMTLDPQLGTDLVSIMNDLCEDAFQKYGVKSEIRLTPNDTRDYERPVRQRSSKYLDNMLQLFEKGAKAGGNLLSIESTGGKEVCDDALMNCNIRDVVFSLAVLGVRDMQFLWDKITDIADSTRTIPGGDTACGFGNTAMVLAEKKYIPKVFAAVVRIVTVVRTLVALEEGARGPDKDCGYEGPFLKAITGTPISMEGRTAACAHLSPLGNIAGACCDLWSNESVTNIKLLAGMAPTVYMEQLIYDTRLFNQATKLDGVDLYKKIMVESDIHLDPQALILDPVNVIEISKAIVSGKNYVDAAILGSLKGLEIIENHVKDGLLYLEDRELVWIDMLRDELGKMPREEGLLVAEVEPSLDKNKVLLQEYGL